jgi:hypothetical protein
MKQANRKRLGVLVGLEVVAAGLAWCDLAKRSDDQVRGKKNLWRAFVSINPGNSIVYWVVGRRRARI